MFLTFSASKKKPDVSTLRGTRPLEEVLVRNVPEIDNASRTETWVVDRQPGRPLARSHVLTLWAGDHMIGSGRISTITCLARHWVTFRLAGTRSGMRVRVPIPWAGLSGHASYTHTTQFLTLSPSPEPHEAFRNSPDFADPDANPYEFELTAGKEIRLRAQLQSNPDATDQVDEAREEGLDMN
ncbi:uncharacterized protein C8Q71DRAFT_721919 [Rhodofomes roseus]|uniref:Uncharacterized protein n=1 Tax=Rhodofomes roseus TaxID=34475 RepID=A0ABQ8KQJ3_9APHY|nr:uncharacterized protein C8Q71DRAFT_721919 [Rhodofomes roseus]KAH9840201.1 hypothetical protein C8Q71DRAFT_721919 [Rhodofomes roseus]